MEVPLLLVLNCLSNNSRRPLTEDQIAEDSSARSRGRPSGLETIANKEDK